MSINSRNKVNYPVDKNRTTTGGQSGPPYLQLWPQQEDSPDHASWVFVHPFAKQAVHFAL